jgi:hypothetical protein
VSLGYHEQDDADVVIEYLKSTRKVSQIMLWGRYVPTLVGWSHQVLACIASVLT